MTTTFPTFGVRSQRHPSWYLPLLLPVLPLLAASLGPWVSETGRGLLDGAVLGPLGTLAALGLMLALGGSDLVEHLGRRVRKEVDLLRPAWLASVFLVQASLIGFGRGSGLDLMLFAGTSMLLASMPFGAEFQQRTLASLLSQPVARTDWWSMKHRALGIALLLHWITYLLSRAAYGFDTDLLVAGGTLSAAFLAWGATPWWNLVARGLLPGLVFSITVPMITFFMLVLTVDALSMADTMRVGTLTGDEVWLFLLLFGVAPVYAGVAHRLGRARWLRLEASEQGGVEGGVISLPMFRRGAGDRSERSSIGLHLAAKELRIQTATLLMGVATIVMGLVSLVPMNFIKSPETMIQGGFVMLAGATILMAGASTVAEERRLGTLDSQLILPTSRSLQWWIKIGVALALAVAAGVLLWARRPVIAIGYTIVNPSFTGLMMFTLFATGALASSNSNNTPRALITGLGMTAVGFVAFGLLEQATQFLANRNAFEQWDQIRLNLPAWREAVAALDIRRLERDQSRVIFAAEWMRDIGRPLLLALPSLLALYLARRNFLRPSGRRGRGALQYGLCLGLLGGAMGLEVGTGGVLWQVASRTDTLLMVKSYFRRLDRLTVAERQLYETYGDQSINLDIGIQLRNPSPRRLNLPLSPDDRQLLLDEAVNLPANLRTPLERDAERDPRKPTPRRPVPASAAPADNLPKAPTFQMSPELMKRYGLIAPAASPATTTNPAAEAASGATLQMSPALMKRYGLAGPATSPTSATNPAAESTPPTTFRMSPEMMRRYGLVPPNSPSVPTNPTPGTPAPQP